MKRLTHLIAPLLLACALPLSAHAELDPGWYQIKCPNGSTVRVQVTFYGSVEGKDCNGRSFRSQEDFLGAIRTTYGDGSSSTTYQNPYGTTTYGSNGSVTTTTPDPYSLQPKVTSPLTGGVAIPETDMWGNPVIEKCTGYLCY